MKLTNILATTIIMGVSAVGKAQRVRSKAMMTKRALAAGAVAMGLLLGSSTAQAVMVIQDPVGNATGIMDLHVDTGPVPLQGFYNLVFQHGAPVAIFGTSVPGFYEDLGPSFVQAANNALNSAAPEVTSVGTSPNTGTKWLFPLTYENDAFASIENLCTGGPPCQWNSGGIMLDALGNEPGTFAVFEKVTVVPLPAAVWLFGSGLLGLAGLARRKTV